MTRVPNLSALDHLVLTVADIQTTVSFYEGVFGMTAHMFNPANGTEHWALSFGQQKINLHQAGAEFEPKADCPTPGSADLCFLSDTPLAEWSAHLTEHDIPVELGPVPRTGAAGALTSLYVRDPDHNLIEISNLVSLTPPRRVTQWPRASHPCAPEPPFCSCRFSAFRLHQIRHARQPPKPLAPKPTGGPWAAGSARR